MDKISIILPVYNVGNYIEKCLDSIISQNFQGFELIVIDDRGEEQSLEICCRKLVESGIENKSSRIHQILDCPWRGISEYGSPQAIKFYLLTLMIGCILIFFSNYTK